MVDELQRRHPNGFDLVRLCSSCAVMHIWNTQKRWNSIHHYNLYCADSPFHVRVQIMGSDIVFWQQSVPALFESGVARLLARTADSAFVSLLHVQKAFSSCRKRNS